MNKKSVMVFIEQNGGNIAQVSLELISKARELADKLQVSVTAIACGHNLQDKLKPLGKYGVDEIYYADDMQLNNFTTLPYAKFVAKMIRKHEPQIVLFGATLNGRDLAPRVSANLQCGLTADCTELAIGDYEFKGKKWDNILLQVRPAFGGNIIATIVSPESSPSMSTVREGVMLMKIIDANRSAKINLEPHELTENDFLTEIVEVMVKERSVNLAAARIVVAAGMGAADGASINLIKELAALLGAEVACTRPVADAGFFSKEYQIGQTGATVRPTLYIACGISGQIQHTIGMKDSGRIIAIDKDPKAPIFSMAHYSIVGDVKDVLEKMIKKLRNNQ